MTHVGTRVGTSAGTLVETWAGDHQRAWRHLPVATLDAIAGRGNFLVLAPHADDESLGCGGLIAAAVAAGRAPVVAILTDGTGSHPHSLSFPPPRLRAVRAAEATEAVRHLGLSEDSLVFLAQQDTRAPHAGPAFDAVVDQLKRLMALRQCTTIFAPWIGDPHCDHHAAALMAAATGARQVAFPVWGWTLAADAQVPWPVLTGYRLDITPHRVAKQRAIQAHRSQYGGLIQDDPQGFSLPADLLSSFAGSTESFLLP
jgi:LmbE family N-acetylglucosaminyl deacetylase